MCVPKKLVRSLFLMSTFILGSVGLVAPAAANDYSIKDVERFAELFTVAKPINADDLAQNYLNEPSFGQRILQPRMGGSDGLAKAVNNNKAIYERALTICLPALSTQGTAIDQRIKKVTGMFGEPFSIPVSITIAANNTAATVNAEGIALALEVICQQVKSKEELMPLILDYVGHESVHVMQYRNIQRTDLNFNVLELALIEGSADFIAQLATGKASPLDAERTRYGLAHKHALWTQFLKVKNSHQYAPWFYSPAKGKQPADMGYWIGKQIAHSFYVNSDNKQNALQQLITLRDAENILEESQYGKPGNGHE